MSIWIHFKYVVSTSYFRPETRITFLLGKVGILPFEFTPKPHEVEKFFLQFVLRRGMLEDSCEFFQDFQKA